jgi:multidrug efflux system membrane fusion protein
MTLLNDIQAFLRRFYEKNKYICLVKNFYAKSNLAAHVSNFCLTNKYTILAKNYYSKHKLITLIVAASLIVLIFSKLFFHSNTSEKDDGVKNKQPPLVLVSLVRKENIPVYLTALGSVNPSKSVVIKTQINGQLLKVLFEEGQSVKEGDLLAEIDTRLYDAQLLQYEGQLMRDKAILKNAMLDHERYKKLVKQGAISSQTLDTQKSLVQQYEGTVKSDQGLVDSAKLNRTYCHIKSPISGKVGLRLVDPGNYVQVSDPSGLVIVNSIDPIYVVFSIPQDNLQAVLQRMKNGEKLKVDAYDREQNQMLETGNLSIVDNQIDTTTGTVKLKALFQNEDNRFFPNQFVNVRLLVNTLNDSITVPTAAIQHSPNGSFVYKVQQNQTVKVVLVEIKTTNGSDTAISGDLKPNDSIVIEGTDKLYDGANVKVSEHKLKTEPSNNSSEQNAVTTNNKVLL